jgi:hypothetical protein
MQSQWQQNLYTTERYILETQKGTDIPDIIFVGTSLTNRLDFEHDSKCIYNLSLQGDSSLTGLTVISKSPQIPHNIFVEINIPNLHVNNYIVDKSLGALPRTFNIFKVENMPINFAINIIQQFRDIKEESSVAFNTETLKTALVLQIKQYSKTIDLNTLEKSKYEFISLINELESRGATVIFYEMPIHPDLEQLPRAVQIRDFFLKTFPNHRLLLYKELTKGNNIKTTDGIHLLRSEATSVVKVFEDLFSDPCTKQPVPK